MPSPIEELLRQLQQNGQGGPRMPQGGALGAPPPMPGGIFSQQAYNLAFPGQEQGQGQMQIPTQPQPPTTAGFPGFFGRLPGIPGGIPGMFGSQFLGGYGGGYGGRGGYSGRIF